MNLDIYLAEEISKQSVEDAAWSLLAAYSKTQEERDKLRKELLSKKEVALEDVRGSWHIQSQRMLRLGINTTAMLAL